MYNTNTVKLGYKVTVYNIDLFTTTHMAGTDSMVSVLKSPGYNNNLPMVITAHFNSTKGVVVNKFDCIIRKVSFREDISAPF